MKAIKGLAAFAAIAAVQPAAAAPPILYPVQTGWETLRFDRGVTTLDLETESGAVQITPLPMDHGSLAFDVGVYNKRLVGSTNFGIENVFAATSDQTIGCLSSYQLQAKAKNRAMWSTIGIAVLAGASAAALSTARTHDTYRSSVRTPHGTYRFRSTYSDNSIGVLGAAGATVAGVSAIEGVQDRLDYTLRQLSGDSVQTTTVDHEESYGGRIVLEKIKDGKLPQDIRLLIGFNGESYPFTFRLTKPGENQPAGYVERMVPIVRAPAAAPIYGMFGIPPVPIAKAAPSSRRRRG